MATIVRPLVFICILAFLAGCIGHPIHEFRRGVAGDLTGLWDFQEPEIVRGGTDRPPAMVPRWTIEFKPDGTFKETIENHIMMTMLADGAGSYRREGNLVVLTGSSHVYMDDGYQKSNETRPIDYRMKYAADTLTVTNSPARGGPLVFRRRSSVPPPKVEFNQEKSDPGAVKIVNELEARYAALASYEDEGTMASEVESFLPGKTKFVTRFARPHRFLFEATHMDGGKAFDQDAVWSDGKKSWIYMGSVGGQGEERPLDNGLGVISVTSGYETTLVPGLLMPNYMRGGTLHESFQKLKQLADRRANGKLCSVIALESSRGARVQLWIDKSSGLILRAIDGPGRQTISYKPQANPHLATKDFQFTPPK